MTYWLTYFLTGLVLLAFDSNTVCKACSSLLVITLVISSRRGGPSWWELDDGPEDGPKLGKDFKMTKTYNHGQNTLIARSLRIVRVPYILRYLKVEGSRNYLP